MITPHSISGSFNEYLYNFVRPFEAFRQRVYSDPRGIPTLGVGYALVIYSDVLGRWELRDTLQSDLRAAGILGENQAFSQQDLDRLQDAVDVLNGVANAINLIPPAIREESDATAAARNIFSFPLITEAQARILHDVRVQDYINILRSKLGDGLVDQLANSNELAALVSLAFNGGGALIGDNLTAALSSGDRAEAWFEIRYKTNAQPPSTRLGIAKRRYAESDMFGLYNEASVFDTTEAEARSILAMFTRHRREITAYEADAQLTQALATTDPAVAQVRFAEQVLIDLFGSNVLGSGALSTSDGRIWVGNDTTLTKTRKNGTVTYSVHDNMTGSAESDLMLGQGGKDTLRGAGGADALYGEVDDDSLFGDDGNDVLLGGTGEDKLYGGAGEDRYVHRAGDGIDTVIDHAGDPRGGDGQGRLVAIDSGGVSRELIGNKQASPSGNRGWAEDEHYLYVFDGRIDVNGNPLGRGVLLVVHKASGELLFRVEGFTNGELGLTLLTPVISRTTYTGTPGNDTNASLGIPSGGGAKIILAGAGDDRIVNGEADDQLHGEDGDDILIATLGNDELHGGAGNDELYGEADINIRFGGDGDDQLQGGLRGFARREESSWGFSPKYSSVSGGTPRTLLICRENTKPHAPIDLTGCAE